MKCLNKQWQIHIQNQMLKIIFWKNIRLCERIYPKTYSYTYIDMYLSINKY